MRLHGGMLSLGKERPPRLLHRGAAARWRLARQPADRWPPIPTPPAGTPRGTRRRRASKSGRCARRGPRCAAKRRPWPSGMLAPIQTCRLSRKPAPMRMPTAQPSLQAGLDHEVDRRDADQVPRREPQHEVDRRRDDDQAGEAHHAAATPLTSRNSLRRNRSKRSAINGQP